LAGTYSKRDTPNLSFHPLAKFHAAVKRLLALSDNAQKQLRFLILRASSERSIRP
jgi:hypothetical protein